MFSVCGHPSENKQNNRPALSEASDTFASFKSEWIGPVWSVMKRSRVCYEPVVVKFAISTFFSLLCSSKVITFDSRAVLSCAISPNSCVNVDDNKIKMTSIESIRTGRCPNIFRNKTVFCVSISTPLRQNWDTRHNWDTNSALKSDDHTIKQVLKVSWTLCILIRYAILSGNVCSGMCLNLFYCQFTG